ncbi:F-box protein [Candidatus Odyssella thessalonicensis]|uniref:F-box protein n=1 Tax=Candidatus Odyssella thessalonicensis TaxID=84647 RepID=UPI000225B94B|nr:hypothetical protein [Candidatus Odyssella thessalonicensis]
MPLKLFINSIILCSSIYSIKVFSLELEDSPTYKATFISRSSMSCFCLPRKLFSFLSLTRDMQNSRGDWQIVENQEIIKDDHLFFADFPAELIEAVSYYCTPRDIVNLASTCRELHNFFSREMYWKMFVKLGPYSKSEQRMPEGFYKKNAFLNYYYLEGIKSSNPSKKRAYIRKAAALGHGDASALINYWRKLKTGKNIIQNSAISSYVPGYVARKYTLN